LLFLLLGAAGVGRGEEKHQELKQISFHLIRKGALKKGRRKKKVKEDKQCK